MTTEHTVVRFRQIKKKAVQFKCGRLPANYRELCLQLLEQAILPDACFAEVARRYGIAERVLFRWKQELTQVAPLFVAVEIADVIPPTEEHTS